MNITLVVNRQRPSTVASKMDISTFLNPSNELGEEVEVMDVDSPTSIPYQSKHSPQGSHSIKNSPDPSPSQSCVYPHGLPANRLPVMQTQDQPSLQDQVTPNNTLPSLKFLLQDISPRTITSSKGSDDCCTKMAMLEVQKKALLHSSPPPLHYSRSTEGIGHSFYGYHCHGLLPEQDTLRFARRRPHRSSSTSPRSPHNRILRRGSHLQVVSNVPMHRAPADEVRYRQPLIVAQDQDIYYMYSSSPVSNKSRKTTHNNKPYTVEMVDWIRYHKVDKNMQFKIDMLPLFFKQFPDRYDPDATEQILSSRYYRDNRRPLLDEEGNWYVKNKSLALTSDKVRDRVTAEGKELDVPASLVERAPWRVVSGKYDHWKSPISEADKEKARQILKGDDPNDPDGKRAEWRRIFRETEHLMYKDLK